MNRYYISAYFFWGDFMKKKFLVLTLCFTLVFSSLSYKKSYADGGIISLPMLATVSALAVGTGIAINNIDDLYDLGKMFYDYVDRHNDLTWSTIQSLFAASVSLQPNKLVSVESEFLNIPDVPYKQVKAPYQYQ